MLAAIEAAQALFTSTAAEQMAALQDRAARQMAAMEQ